MALKESGFPVRHHTEELVDTSHSESGGFNSYARQVNAARAETVLVQPESLLLQVGNLTVRTRERALDGLISPQNIEVLLDGKPIAARRCSFVFDIHEAPVIELTFFPEEGRLDRKV